jgi:hypothetical protein
MSFFVPWLMMQDKRTIRTEAWLMQEGLGATTGGVATVPDTLLISMTKIAVIWTK